MASEVVGTVGSLGGYVTEVYRNADGTVTIFAPHEGRYDAGQLARLRELLDRAAMPGQPATAPGVDVAELGRLAAEVERLAAEQDGDDG